VNKPLHDLGCGREFQSGQDGGSFQVRVIVEKLIDASSGRLFKSARR
jgi:hypothetical protein